MVIVVAALKGGVGKTAVTLHLAGEALARRLRVLVVDADPQRSAMTWAEVAAEKGLEAPAVICAPARLHRDLPRETERYDVVLVDCPPRDDSVTREAIMCADLVVVPIRPAPLDFWAMTAMAKLIGRAREARPTLRAVLLLNAVQARQTLSAQAPKALAEFNIPILRSTLGHRIAFAEAITAGQSVAAFAPHSVAAEEVRQLFKEMRRIYGNAAKAA